MPDYNIYLHSDVSNQDNPTKPWTSDRKPTVPKEDSKTGEGVAEVLNTVANPDSLISKGIGAVSKSIPYVLVAYAVNSLVDKAVSTAQKFEAIHTGNYSGQIAYNNFKTTLRAGFQPFSTVMNFIEYKQTMEIQRERLELNRSLLGESVINSFNGRSV